MSNVREDISVVETTTGYFVSCIRTLPDKQVQYRAEIDKKTMRTLYDISEEITQKGLSPVLPPDRKAVLGALKREWKAGKITDEAYKTIDVALIATRMGRANGLTHICTGLKELPLEE